MKSLNKVSSSRIAIFILISISLSGCAAMSKMGETLTGKGTGEITPIGNGQFDILVAASFSANRQKAYEKWDRTAKKACDDGEYKIIEREWQSTEYPGLLGGIIECAN